MPAFKGGHWQKNVLLNQIGGDECILDTKPRATGSRILSGESLEKKEKAPIPEYHVTRWPPTLGEVGWKIVGDAYLLIRRREGIDFDEKEQNEMEPTEMAAYLIQKMNQESYQNGSVSGNNLHDWEMWALFATREMKAKYEEVAKLEDELIKELKTIVGAGILSWIERYLQEYAGEVQRRRTILLGDSSTIGKRVKRW